MNFNTENLTQDYIEDSRKILEDTTGFLFRVRKINLFASFVVILLGLLGNCVTIFVLAQKKYRVNSSHVYFLCLSINDALFLIVHFFEVRLTLE
jgi:hypothetical protein